MHRSVALAMLLLAGCASPPFEPAVFEVKDRGAYAADLATCRTEAAAARKPLSLRSIGSQGAEQGLKNAPGGAVNPLVPGIAAIGGSAAELVDELNLNGQSDHRLIADCMKRKGDKSGAYFVLDPNE